MWKQSDRRSIGRSLGMEFQCALTCCQRSSRHVAADLARMAPLRTSSRGLAETLVVPRAAIADFAEHQVRTCRCDALPSPDSEGPCPTGKVKGACRRCLRRLCCFVSDTYMLVVLTALGMQAGQVVSSASSREFCRASLGSPHVLTQRLGWAREIVCASADNIGDDRGAHRTTCGALTEVRVSDLEVDL